MIEEKRWKKEFELEFLEEENPVEAKEPFFSIDSPPPYVNAPLHLGHISGFLVMDFVARYKRMRGFNVLFPLGFDRNGLPIEIATEKKFKVDIKKVEREEFIALCKKLLDEYSEKSFEDLKRVGISFNSWEFSDKLGTMYYTDSPEYRAFTQSTFIDLWNRGLIYEANRVSNYCPECRTTIADSEIEYKKMKGKYVHIVFDVENGEKIVIATTRPELLGACAAIIYNPEDERYKHLKGKKAKVPIYGQEVEIIEDNYAKKDKGTGLVMMCSYGDYTDIVFFRDHGLKEKILINEDGTMNELAGPLKGLKIEDARERIIELLKEEGRVKKIEEIEHDVPICERSKTPIQFIYMKELYLKQLDKREELLKIVDQIWFANEEWRTTLKRWINNIKFDWAISRRRVYATEIPLWYCRKCGYKYVPEKGKYYKPWKEDPGVDCPNCGAHDWEGEKRVFDTWFDSSLTPLFILKYHKDPSIIEKFGNCSLRVQGKDIIRTWLYYTILRGYLELGRPIFENVIIHGHILDDKGKKMSKSLGNVIAPKELLDRFGAEPVRLWVAMDGEFYKSDYKCNFEIVGSYKKLLTKIWNIGRFISRFERKNISYGEVSFKEADKSILNEFHELAEKVEEAYESFNFYRAAHLLRDFIWDDFASHYVELVKDRAYKGDDAAIFTLYYVFEGCLNLFYPIIPFITQKLLKELGGEKKYPEKRKRFEAISFKEIKEFNSDIWARKKELGIKINEEIKVDSSELPAFSEELLEDLKAMHKIVLR